MLTLLVVPDGAAEPVRTGPTCLEAARTPALDRLAAEGRLLRVATIPEGCAAGTEVGLPVLLGADRAVPLPRGLVEAAAAGVRVRRGQAAWRLDRPVGQAADAGAMDVAVRQLGARVHPLGAHRALLVGPAAWGDAPPGPHQTAQDLTDLAAGPFAAVAAATGAWPWGRAVADDLPDVPTVLDRPVTVVATGGAPAGIAAVLGCDVADGDPVAAVADADADAVVVVHCPEPDDAAHARDRAGKIAALEAVDALTARIAAVVARRAGQLLVCPDHGCDPDTGRHTAGPVPALAHTWPAGRPARSAADPAAGGRAAPRRLTERAVRGLEIQPAPALLAAREAVG